MTCATMVISIASPTGYGGVRRIAVSLPRVDALIADQPTKYSLPVIPGVADVQPDPPARRGARWTSHGRAGYSRSSIWRRQRRREQSRREARELNELARMLGDPV